MGKCITFDPCEELQEKIRRAREAVATKARRTIRCPYCRHNAIVVFADATGYVQTKCAKCRTELVIDVVNMRRIR